MQYLQLTASEYYNMPKVINLVLDQHQRKKDLFYNIRVFSNCPFMTTRASFGNLKSVVKLVVPNSKGGGTPSSPLFYTNPQFYFHFDRSKVSNPALVDKIDTLITYKNDT